jgi:hypothetical protein
VEASTVNTNTVDASTVNANTVNASALNTCGLGPGQNIQEMEVRVHEDIPARAPPHGTAGLADFQGRFEQPAGEGAALLFPVGGQVIAPLFRPAGNVVEFLPFRLIARDQAQLPHKAAPDGRRFLQRDGLK